MKFEFQYCLIGDRMIKKVSTAVTTLVEGDLVAISSGLAVLAGAAAAAGTVLGVVEKGYENGSVHVDINPFSVYKASFEVDGTKKTFAAADCWGSLFDIKDNTQLIDPDDTTGGFIMIVDEDKIDNTGATVNCIIGNRVFPIIVAAAE